MGKTPQKKPMVKKKKASISKDLNQYLLRRFAFPPWRNAKVHLLTLMI